MSAPRHPQRLSRPACVAAQALARILSNEAADPSNDVCVAAAGASGVLVRFGDAARGLFADPGVRGAVAYWGRERDAATGRQWAGTAAGPLAALLVAAPALVTDFGCGPVNCGPTVVVPAAATVPSLPDWSRVPRDLRLRRFAFVPTAAGGVAVELPVRWAAVVMGATAQAPTAARVRLPLTTTLLARCHGSFPRAFRAAAVDGDETAGVVCVVGLVTTLP